MSPSPTGSFLQAGEDRSVGNGRDANARQCVFPSPSPLRQSISGESGFTGGLLSPCFSALSDAEAIPLRLEMLKAPQPSPADNSTALLRIQKCYRKLAPLLDTICKAET